MAKEDGKVLLISEDAVVKKEYNTTSTDVTWETCSLRTWLNGSFMDDAFSPEEAEKIVESTVTANKNPEYHTSPGNDTTDKVFLLSIDEVNQYFSSDEERICKYNGSACVWWLRSPGIYSSLAACVDSDGSIFDYGSSVNSANGGVRPALWIDLGS